MINQLQHFFKTICLICLNSMLIAAFAAFIMDAIALAVGLQTRRLHHPAAFAAAVARIDIDMLGPETMGAMIGIAVTFDARAAIFTSKIFHALLEFFRRQTGRGQPLIAWLFLYLGHIFS